MKTLFRGPGNKRTRTIAINSAALVICKHKTYDISDFLEIIDSDGRKVIAFNFTFLGSSIQVMNGSAPVRTLYKSIAMSEITT